MSENKRTPEQIFEEANAFLEKAGVTAALEEFVSAESVRDTVDHYAKLCEEDIQALVDSQKDELIAKAEAAGVCDGIVEGFKNDFPINFRIFLLLDHIELLKAYGVGEMAISIMLSNVLATDAEILHELVKTVCLIQWDKQYKIAYENLEKLESGEAEVPEEEPITCENCGETGCPYDEDCQELGSCPKGKEFHCNGKGKMECDCPCALSCGPSAGIYPCMQLDFTVIPPEGGCCERGVN